MTRVAVFALVLLLALFLAPMPSGNAQKADADRPSGEWRQDTGSSITFKTPNRLTWKVVTDKGHEVISFDADYGVTKDSRIYGIVTKSMYKPGSMPSEDDTFSFRFRIDEDELNVKDVKGSGFEQLKVYKVDGRYKKVEDKPKDKPKDK